MVLAHGLLVVMGPGGLERWMERELEVVVKEVGVEEGGALGRPADWVKRV